MAALLWDQWYRSTAASHTVSSCDLEVFFSGTSTLFPQVCLTGVQAVRLACEKVVRQLQPIVEKAGKHASWEHIIEQAQGDSVGHVPTKVRLPARCRLNKGILVHTCAYAHLRIEASRDSRLSDTLIPMPQQSWRSWPAAAADRQYFPAACSPTWSQQATECWRCA